MHKIVMDILKLYHNKSMNGDEKRKRCLFDVDDNMTKNRTHETIHKEKILKKFISLNVIKEKEKSILFIKEMKLNNIDIY